MKIRRRARERRQVGNEPLFETQGIAAVLVVAANAPELAIAALAVAGDRGVVAHMHFEADGATVARERGGFGGLEQHRADPASAHVRRNCQGIEAREE